MATVVATFDTSSKELAVSVDGTPVPDVCSVEFCHSWDDPDDFRCIICTESEDEVTEMRSMTRMMASETVAAKDAFARGVASVSLVSPDLLEWPELRASSLDSAVRDYFTK